MKIKYLDGILTEEELLQINELSDGAKIQFYSKKPAFMNAALDELVGDIFILFSSNEAAAIANATTIAGGLIAVIGFIIKTVKKRTVTKITSNTQTIKPVNVIIQVDNIMILQPENPDAISINDYLSLALHAAASPYVPKKKEIIISYDDGIHIETINQYARRKMKM